MYLFIFVGGEVHYGMKRAYPNNPSRVRNQTLSIQSPVRVLTTRCDEFLGLPRPQQVLYILKIVILFNQLTNPTVFFYSFKKRSYSPEISFMPQKHRLLTSLKQHKTAFSKMFQNDFKLSHGRHFLQNAKFGLVTCSTYFKFAQLIPGIKQAIATSISIPPRDTASICVMSSLISYHLSLLPGTKDREKRFLLKNRTQ